MNNERILKDEISLLREAKIAVGTAWLNLDEKIRSEECNNTLREQLIGIRNELWNVRKGLEECK